VPGCVISKSIFLEIIMNASVQQARSDYFNLITSGVGYLNRTRWVATKNTGGRKAAPFLSCSVSALRGSVDAPASTYFDLRVTGREAIEMVERLAVDVEARRKVFISFNAGDIYPHIYDREVRDNRGQKTGEKETAALIKGRLLLINSITIDGVNVYRRDPEAAAPADDDVPPGDDADQDNGEAQAQDAAPEAQSHPVEDDAQPERRAPLAQRSSQPVVRQPQARINGQRFAPRGGCAAPAREAAMA
jgi:hypothetical protein